uniref:Uncharacterized protein n=1 Tax=Cannabis sativa TaxID=3483 RepID=A0A803PLX4_CANSA
MLKLLSLISEDTQEYEDEGNNTSDPSKIRAFSVEHIRAGADFPVKDYVKEFYNYPGITPFNLPQTLTGFSPV